nr:uncharacterized protein LOC112292982 isoform X2 [Physcomitrium patens]|eukprot:XP_024397762.1 uncharacterized protein LOC112292982 isoform X2 [Physcomitrella patens]
MAQLQVLEYDLLAKKTKAHHSLNSGRILVGILAACLLYLPSQVQPVHCSYGSSSLRKFGVHHHMPHLSFPAADGDCVNEWRFAHGRALLQQVTNESNFRPLALRDNRIDPLDNFNKYRGGYDIKNKHYWASVIFTGIYGYAIAAAWLALGLLLLLFACCKCICGPREHFKRPRSRAFYWTPRIIVFLLSAVAIGASVILLIASRKFNSQVYNVQDVIVGAAQNATDNIRNVSASLHAVKDIVLPYNQPLYQTLNRTETKLDSLALVVSEKVFVNKKTYQKVFKIVEVVLIVVTSLNLLLIILGFASTFLRWRRIFYLIIVVTWIFIALTWVMFGFFFTVHFIADDTCLAFKQYLQNPENTTLDELLPCADLASSSTQYLQVREAMKSVITSATEQFLYYANGSSGLIGVCDPIGPPPDYTYTGGGMNFLRSI